MATVDPGRAPVTWDELVHSRPEITEDWEAMKRYREEMGIHIH
jgi:dihydropyrimidine dehydrogenase (NAD+) subunit PreA